MTVKLMEESDVNKVRDVHQKFYRDEFEFPFDGQNRLMDKYLIESDKGEVIIFGALELVTEAIVITNKNIEIKERREAFYKMLQCLMFNASNHGFNSFHLSAQEKKWAQHLIKKFGFKKCKGEFLFLEV